METIYDWISVAIFAGLLVLFLQRSAAETQVDRVIDYFPAALGCAVGNYLGNNDQPILAVLVLVAVIVYIWIVLKPFVR